MGALGGARWAAAMGPINLPPDALPAQANAVLDRTARLFERLDQARAAPPQARRGRARGRAVRRRRPDARRRASPPTSSPRTARSSPSCAAVRARRAPHSRPGRPRETGQPDQAGSPSRNRPPGSPATTIAQARGTLDTLRRRPVASDDELPAVEERSARRLKLEQDRDDLNAAAPEARRQDAPRRLPPRGRPGRPRRARP